MDALKSWLMANGIQLAVGALSIALMVILYSNWQLSQRSKEFNAIITSVQSKYQVGPYTSAASEDDTKLLVQSTHLPAAWSTLDGSDAKTPWTTDWSLTVTPNSLTVATTGAPQDVCQTIAQGLPSSPRIAEVKVNGQAVDPGTLTQQQYQADINSLPGQCASGATNAISVQLN